MKEIDKELRLPREYTSWFSIARDLQSQDELSFKTNEPKIVFCKSMNEFWEDIPELDGAHVEVFQADVLTLKVRAFDELNEIIPNAVDLLGMLTTARIRSHETQQFTALYDPMNDPTVVFLEKLVQLFKYIR